MRPFLLAAMGLFVLASAAQAQRLFRWVDDKGQVHYSDSVPVVGAGPKQTELSSEGRVVKVLEAPAAQQKDNGDAPALDAAAQERARQRDLILLKTFGSVEEIESAKRERLAQIDNRIQNGEERLKSLDEQISAIEARAARKDRKLPSNYELDLATLRKSRGAVRVTLDDELEHRRDEEARFDAALARMKELKPESVAQPSDAAAN